MPEPSTIVRPSLRQKSNSNYRQPPPRAHLIDDYSVAQDRVVCICAWAGSVEEYTQHRRDAGMTKK